MKILLHIAASLLCTTALVFAQEDGAVQAHAEGPETGMVHIDNFYIDIYEHPNQRGSLPTVDITYAEAEALCADLDKRLCSELEWQRAATGPENFPYSYGEVFESGRCNTRQNKTGNWVGGASLAASGAFAQCHNSYGLYDMIGNVWEWTSSWYAPDKGWRAVRGGSYFHSANMSRADARYGHYLDAAYRLDLVGFRCCRSSAPELPVGD